MPFGDDNEMQLLDKAREGDMAAFQALFEQQRGLVHGLAYRLVGPNDCDDVVMDACLHAWQALPGFTGYSGWPGWLCRIVRNCSMDELRRRKRRTEDLVSKDDDEHQETTENVRDPKAASPAELALHRDLGETISRALEQLSAEHRTTLLLREVDGTSYLDIARITGVNVGTVMSRLFNARRKLRRILEDDYHESA